jgi:hypothetical protein
MMIKPGTVFRVSWLLFLNFGSFSGRLLLFFIEALSLPAYPICISRGFWLVAIRLRL